MSLPTMPSMPWTVPRLPGSPDPPPRRWRDLEPFPCTISAPRFGGTIEGGKWVAYPWSADEMPRGAETGRQFDAINWWESSASRYVGRGDTPDAAYADMLRRIAEAKEPA